MEKIGGNAKLKKIAITGGVAVGKSTACELFKKHGAHLVNSDAIVHRLLESNPNAIEKVRNLLGDGVFTQGKIDRMKVANVVFKDPQKLRDLEKVLHPEVIKEIDGEAKKCQSPLFVAEVPLLFEAGHEDHFDCIIAIKSTSDEAIARYKKAGHDIEDYDRRMARQIGEEEKSKRADYTIANDGSIKQLEDKVLALMQEIGE